MSYQESRDVTSERDEMEARVRRFDWGATALGPRQTWCPELRTAVTLLLNCETPMALYWGADFVSIYNDAFRTVIGKRHPEALGRSAREALGDLWPDFEPALCGAASSLGSAFSYRPIDSDNSIAYHSVQFKLTALPYGDGAVGGVLQSTCGYNNHRQALEETVRVQDEKIDFLENSLSEMGDRIHIWDRNKRLLGADGDLQTLWGQDSANGTALPELDHPTDLVQQLSPCIDQVLTNGGRVKGEVSFASAAGEQSHCVYFLSPLRGADGSVNWVAGLLRNSVHQKQAWNDLRRSENRYQTLFDSISQGFCVFEILFDDSGKPSDYRWLETNPAFTRHTGLHDAVGRTARELVPRLETHWVEIYGRVAITGEPERFVEHSQAMGRWFEVDAFRVGDPEEHKVALLFTDATQRRNTEQALKEANRRKDNFIATLAHELRNPLAAIRAGVEVMKLAHNDPIIMAKTCQTLERQTEQLVVLVDDLLDVSRITHGKLELRLEPVQLSDVITSVIEASRPQIESRNHNLIVELPSEAVILNADPHRLAQVLSNILNNAAKYTQPEGHITLTARLQDSELAIAVKDDGIGIPSDRLDQIFQMFTQIDRSSEQSYSGLGVGLALAKMLTEMHGGYIQVESAGVGRGSTFTVRLPADENYPKEIPRGETMHTVEPEQVCHRVLVVDDNEDATKMLSMLIEMLGHKVVTANSGLQALTVAEQFSPEVVFMDIGMPGMDGFETAQRMRGQAWGQSFLLVALSGWGEDKDKRKSKECGFDHHLVKPIELAELQEVLSRLSPSAQA